MVDWDRVQELRSKGWDWADIAEDPKVDFHADASAGAPGRALRALYHRTGRRAAQTGPTEGSAKRPRKEETERKWTLTRIGYLLVPTVGIWALVAFVAPSPVGILVPAVPYLGLVLAAAAVLLIYALWRHTEGRRWTPIYRGTVIGGVVLGLVVAGGIGLGYSLAFGCPYLPPASSLSTNGGSGWQTGPLAAWQDSGVPVVFFYGATWCPYCSASSWAIWKALNGYGTVSGNYTSHSSLTDVYPGTPEMVLASASVSSKNGHGPGVNFQVAEDTSGVDGSYPATATCYQQAYVTAYASGIPFVVINGQVIHVGTLVDPANLAPWNNANGTAGENTVRTSVASESGQPWTYVQGQAWWMMAYIAKASGYTSSTVGTLANDYSWSKSTQANVTADLASLGS